MRRVGEERTSSVERGAGTRGVLGLLRCGGVWARELVQTWRRETVPELAKLMQLREALKALKGPLSNVPNFRKKLQDLVNDEKTRDALLQELGIDAEEDK